MTATVAVVAVVGVIVVVILYLSIDVGYGIVAAAVVDTLFLLLSEVATMAQSSGRKGVWRSMLVLDCLLSVRQ